MVAVVTVGPYGGSLPPIPVAGVNAGVFPFGCIGTNATYTATASTAVYIACPIFRTTAFAGVQIYDKGAATGSLVRIGLYAESVTGGPGALLKDFGAITTTGGPTILRAASSATVTAQMAYLAFNCNSSTWITYGMDMLGLITGVGVLSGYQTLSLLSDIGGTRIGNEAVTLQPQAWNVSLTYGAWGATATAPSANVYTSASATVATCPGIELYT